MKMRNPITRFRRICQRRCGISSEAQCRWWARYLITPIAGSMVGDETLREAARAYLSAVGNV